MILLEPNDQIPDLPVIYLLYHVQKHQLNDLALVLDALEHSVELLGEGLEHRGFLVEALPELADQVGHLGKIQVEDLHDLDIYWFWGVVRRVSFVEGGAGEEVLVDVADQLLDDFVHVVVHDCHPLAARRAEALQHELDLVLDQLVRAQRVLYDGLQAFVGLRLALQEVLYLNEWTAYLLVVVFFEAVSLQRHLLQPGPQVLDLPHVLLVLLLQDGHVLLLALPRDLG